MTLTRATLGKLTKRTTKDIEIEGNAVRIQRPTPLEHSQYQMSLVDNEGKWQAKNLSDAILLLVSRMWIDDEGERLFKDIETKQLGTLDLQFYQALSEECQKYAANSEASTTLGESAETTVCGLPAESA